MTSKRDEDREALIDIKETGCCLSANHDRYKQSGVKATASELV